MAIGEFEKWEINRRVENIRKVILSMLVSLDSFFEGPNGEMDWVSVDDETWDYIIDFLSTMDAALLGRVAYQIFEKYWPAAATNPSSPKNEKDFARWIEKTPKTVFSKTLEKVEWKNTKLSKEVIPEEIATLKQQPGNDIVLFGGADIAATFMKLGLIDEYQFIVNPVVLGNGKPLFKAINDKLNLKLLKTKTFSSGVVILYYQPTKK